jgi:hypothetical protein
MLLGFTPTLATAALLLLSNAPAASAEATYNCNSVGKAIPCNGPISGPNETIDWVEGANYTYPEFFMEVWKYNGGSNYNREKFYSVFAYTGSICVSSKTGHGGVWLQGAAGNIAGRQRNHC